jgi:alanine dehydrogenase|tara:strand:+ start:82 stop:1194 length:1113 start_codon:yes stop_codon:yes gene_type:complete
MIIGIPKEIKNNEFRVSLTPEGASALTLKKFTVLVEKDAGKNSNFFNEDYEKAGATIIETRNEIFRKSDMILKVKEPIEEEYDLIREDQIVFTYFHFASHRPLLDAMIKSKSICIAYETVEDKNRSLPLLTPMSEVAGRMATQEGAKFLEKPMGGRGILLGGVTGVDPAKVLVIGGGISGTESAKMAVGLGADVTILDTNQERLNVLKNMFGGKVNCILSTEESINKYAKESDLIIGAVLIPGAKAPKLLTKDSLKSLKNRCVLVDIAIDQGGCFETSKPTTHENPVYVVDDILHYCVANMPGAVPYTSTKALTNMTLPYVIEIAEKGWKEASKKNNEIKTGLNIVRGKVVNKNVSDCFQTEYNNPDSLI